MIGMHNQPRKILKRSALTLIVVAILSYGYFQSRNFLYGPSITILEPVHGETYTDSLVNITGSAKRISYLELNDRQIFIDENSNFNEKLLLADGYNIMVLKARDRFGREETKTLEIVYSPKENIFDEEQLLEQQRENNLKDNGKKTEEGGESSSKEERN